MFDVGGGELVFIVLAILLLFGPKKIPEVAQMIGKGMREFRRAQDGLRAQIREVTAEIDDPFSDKPVAPKVFKSTEPAAPLHETEAPGQMSLLDNSSQPETVQTTDLLKDDLVKEEAIPEHSVQADFVKPVIRPAENSVARPGRRPAPPPEMPQSE